jgi:ferredoxin
MRVAEKAVSSTTGYGESKAMGSKTRLFVRVMSERCQGHARCVVIAPELFELDGFGNGHALRDGLVPEGSVDKAWLAQANCPELAVDITEEKA